MDAETHARLIAHAEEAAKRPTSATSEQLAQLGRIMSTDRARREREAS